MAPKPLTHRSRGSVITAGVFYGLRVTLSMQLLKLVKHSKGEA